MTEDEKRDLLTLAIKHLIERLANPAPLPEKIVGSSSLYRGAYELRLLA